MGQDVIGEGTRNIIDCIVRIFLLPVQYSEWILPKSIECFIEGQAFSRSSDLAPRPPSQPSSHLSRQ
jgi:hypothetical protein